MGKTYKGHEARQAVEETDAARESLMHELDRAHPIAIINSTQLAIAIEALIDAKIKWRS